MLRPRRLGIELGELVLEVSSFDIGLREVERSLVRVASLVVTAGAPKQVRAGGVKVAVVIEFEGVDHGQASLRPVNLGHRDGPVEFDNRGAGLAG